MIYYNHTKNSIVSIVMIVLSSLERKKKGTEQVFVTAPFFIHKVLSSYWAISLVPTTIVWFTIKRWITFIVIIFIQSTFQYF